jgi:hypothetical protein
MPSVVRWIPGSRPLSSSRFLLPTWIFAVCLGYFGSLGCVGTANLIPRGADLAPGDEVRIDAGRGILFHSMDGHPVQAAAILALPGARSLRVKVRRKLRDLDGKPLEGVYQVGGCRIRMVAQAGQHYEVLARVFAEERTRLVTDAPAEDREQLMMGVTVHVLNVGSGSERRVPADACEFRVDCSKIDRFTSKAGRECTF